MGATSFVSVDASGSVAGQVGSAISGRPVSLIRVRSATPKPRAASSDPTIIGTPTTRITIPTPLKKTELSTLIATIDSTKPPTRYAREPGTERQRVRSVSYTHLTLPTKRIV